MENVLFRRSYEYIGRALEGQELLILFFFFEFIWHAAAGQVNVAYSSGKVGNLVEGKMLTTKHNKNNQHKLWKVKI